MSEAEFDSYLSLMAKFLRLRSRQKDALADELRDHLESRLDELLAQGKTREQAVSIALEEFGDAAVLAEDFSRLASRHTRRFVMRCTAASAVVVAAVVLLTLAVAPPVPDGAGPPPLAAQDAAPGGEPAADAVPAIPETPSIQQEAIAALDAKLDKVIPEINFVELPLKEALGLIADKIEADVLIDQKALEGEGVTGDTPVSLQLTRTPVAARTVLEFVLEPNHLAFINRSGVLFITSRAAADELLTTKVYNVRDLLGNTSSTTTPPHGMGAGMGGMGGGGFYSIPITGLLAAGIGQLGGTAGEGDAKGKTDSDTGGVGMESGGMGMGMPGGMGMEGMGMPSPSPLGGPANELIHTIQQTTSGPWMDRDGAGGTLTVFGGLLVVRQTEPVHAEIQKLLDALREAAEQQPGSSVTVPKADAEGAPAVSDSHGTAANLLGLRQTWWSLKLETVIVTKPTWVDGAGKQRTTPMGLRVVKVDRDGRGMMAGFREGDVILSWSADRWQRNSNDSNPIAWGGHESMPPDPLDLDFVSARNHGAKAIVFSVIRSEAEGKPRQTTLTAQIPLE